MYACSSKTHTLFVAVAHIRTETNAQTHAGLQVERRGKGKGRGERGKGLRGQIKSGPTECIHNGASSTSYSSKHLFISSNGI